MTDEQKELNRQIAEVKGWELIGDQLVRPSNFNAGDRNYITQKTCPNWAGSVDKALELADEDEWFSLECVPHDMADGPHWTAVMARDDYSDPEGIGKADTPAEAICRAWLAWQESKE